MERREKMHSIYFDNAATSFPKAPGVIENMTHFLENIGCNIQRATSENSLKAESIVYETREFISSLFQFPNPQNVIFTKNITESLNILIKSLLTAKDHVIISSMEHNAITRPLNSKQETGLTVSRIMCNEKGQLDVSKLKESIKGNTKAVIMTHASNVSGTILPLEQIGQICKAHNLFFIIDTAQTGGFLDIDFTKLNADALAFTGHKGLLGPQGIGGFVINDKLASVLKPFIEGGTGSFSQDERQPEYLPDKFEAGTLNIPGIYGLHASLQYLFKTGLRNIRDQELLLTKSFLNEIKNLPGVKIIGLEDTTCRTATISLDFPQFDNALIAYELGKSHKIMTRCGLHCAPSAHKTLGTFPQGTVRFSFSHFNQLKEIQYAIDAIKQCIKKLK